MLKHFIQISMEKQAFTFGTPLPQPSNPSSAGFARAQNIGTQKYKLRQASYKKMPNTDSLIRLNKMIAGLSSEGLRDQLANISRTDTPKRASSKN